MKVSIFKDLTFATGVDHSYIPPVEYSPEIKDEETGDMISPEILASPEKGHPDCVVCIEVDFDPNTQALEIIDDDGEYIVNVIDLPPKEETQEERRSRIYQSIISTESLDDIDLEGEIFSDFEIGELITARVFGGNPHAEKALTNKALAIAISLLQGNPMTEEMQEKIAQAQAKKDEVDAVRNLFNLGNL